MQQRPFFERKYSELICIEVSRFDLIYITELLGYILKLGGQEFETL